ncbi:MAG: NAD-dependent epimerase/dehydratase family protein [Candidatus Eisenbacteria bacterium]|nr:NAD-dependent epimerase/dehydratase family protein [Candidatus Eisenbacteria bacterium]
MLTDKRIVITGGAGFIGSHLVERLAGHNDVVVYDNLHRDALRFTALGRHPRVRFVQGDVRDTARVSETVAGADVIVHAAAIAGIYSVGARITQTLGVNLLGTVAVLDAAAAAGVKRLIEFSTSEVYGPFVYRGKESDQLSIGPTGEPRWTYAISKLAGEFFSYAYATDHGLHVVTIRPFNVYGPRQVGEGAVQQIVHRALAGEDITVFNDGTQVRSWCYVDDFVDGALAAMEADGARHLTLNLGNPQATITVLGLAETIVRLCGSRSKIVFKPHPGPEVEMRVPDIGLAQRTIGFAPKVGLEDGLRRTIDWYKAHLTEGA